MRLAIIGFVGLILGVGGGGFLGGSRVKHQMLDQHHQHVADSIAALEEAESQGEGDAAGHDEGGMVVELTAGGPEASTPSEHPDGDAAATEEHAAEGVATADGEEAGTEPDDTGAGDRTVAGVGAEDATQREDSAQAARLNAELEEGAIKLSKIFGAMKAKDAAAVLQEMSDAEVEAILKHMSNRMAAQVIQEFDPSRAAALSRVVLTGNGGS